MKSRRCWSLSFVLISIALSGCVARNDPLFSKHIRAADQAIENARKRGADKRCPAKFQAVVKLRDDAEKRYMACFYYQAKGMTQDAVQKANALKCPPKVAAKPAPKPAPAPPPPPQAKDSDQDGVIDSQDQCPGTPKGAKVDSRGCWVLSGVLFDTDQSTIKPAFAKILDEAATVMEKNPNLKIEIQGHTDSRGSARYNQGLSQRRANAVMNYFIGKGISRGRLTAKGLGESVPKTTNDTAAGRSENRRVELKPVR